MSEHQVIVGTRGSALARWQSQYVIDRLAAAWPGLVVVCQVWHTRGDRQLDRPLSAIGGKGLFTEELEQALHVGRIDPAVHSLKDLSTQPADGLHIGAIPRRANPADVLVGRAGHSLDSLPAGAQVGTGSPRRAAQLLAARPDLVILPCTATSIPASPAPWTRPGRSMQSSWPTPVWKDGSGWMW